MKYTTKTGPLANIKTECLALPSSALGSLGKQLKINTYLGHVTRDFDNAPGRTLLISLPSTCPIKRLLVLGVGKESQLSDAQLQKVLNAMAAGFKKAGFTSATASLTLKCSKKTYAITRLALDAVSSTLYEFAAQKNSTSKSKSLSKLAIHTQARDRSMVLKAVREGNALDIGASLSRDLANCPPNICNPSYLARSARKFSTDKKTTVKILDERQITKLGMGAFMSVSAGSDQPGKFIIIEYRGGKAKEAPIVLVGKGITFDSGGISLKPGAAMDEMKFDMGGAAAVLGTTSSVIAAKLPINLVTLVAAAENMPSGKASRPGDVVKSLSGQTIEILNTDAEGRLVLCDALTYAERYKPKAVIDVATLTGACVMALGSHATGMFANHDQLAEQLDNAGNFIHDRVWRLPIWDDYQQQLNSNFADMANIGGREAGSITAACFLSRYAKKYHWAHLDIAGTAWLSGARKGSTGRPVPLLFQYLIDQC
ncbi:MAG: leucyl aminopeptidase [Pseudomonadales bacterium]|nr:leucyl aminopeptidase [Pseudomonadales bacterium]